MKKAYLVTVLVLLALLAAMGYYAYQQHQAANMLRLRTENMYQQAFHSLVEHVDTIEVQLSRALATADLEQQMETLSAVWRQVYAAQQELGKLPLSQVPLVNTEKFLSRVGDFTYSIATDSVDGHVLTDREWKILAELKACAVQMSTQLRKLQESIIVNNYRWIEAEEATQRQQGRDNSVVDGLKLVDNKVQEFVEVDVGERVNVVRPPARGPSGPSISQERARETAEEFLAKLGLTNIEYENSVKNQGEIPAWTYMYNVGENASAALDISQTGGYVVWYLLNRSVGKPQLSQQQVVDFAESYLAKIGYNSMELVGFEEYQGEALLTYAYNDGGVLIYPDLIKVRIALDDGSLTGFEASHYLKYHHFRRLQHPKLSLTDVKELIRPELTTRFGRLAVIFNSRGQETLTYELAVTADDESYLVYINSTTGEQEHVLRIDDGLLAKPASVQR